VPGLKCIDKTSTLLGSEKFGPYSRQGQCDGLA